MLQCIIFERWECCALRTEDATWYINQLREVFVQNIWLDLVSYLFGFVWVYFYFCYLYYFYNLCFKLEQFLSTNFRLIYNFYLCIFILNKLSSIDTIQLKKLITKIVWNSKFLTLQLTASNSLGLKIYLKVNLNGTIPTTKNGKANAKLEDLTIQSTAKHRNCKPVNKCILEVLTLKKNQSIGSSRHLSISFNLPF